MIFNNLSPHSPEKFVQNASLGKWFHVGELHLFLSLIVLEMVETSNPSLNLVFLMHVVLMKHEYLNQRISRLQLLHITETLRPPI